MGFTLSQSDVDKVQKSIKITNALTISKKQGRSMGRPTRQYTYVKLSENVLDTGDPTLFWYGDEVGFDEDGAPVVKPNGKAWSITTAPLLLNVAVG